MRRFSLSLPSVLVTSSLTFLFLTACNNESKKEEEKTTDSTTHTPDTTKTGPIKPYSERDNCITLTREQIRTTWTDAIVGWHDNTNANYISLLYAYPEVDPTTDQITVIACPSNRTGKPILTKPLSFSIRTLNPPCEFVPGAEIRMTILEDFGTIFSESGNLLDFEFVRLRPQVTRFQEGGIEVTSMEFVMETVVTVGGNEVATERGIIKPSPPALLFAKDEYEKARKDNSILKTLKEHLGKKK